MPIDNEEHTSSGVVEQTLQELNEHRTADATGNAGETEVPLPRYGGDQVQAEASPGRGDYGRLAARRPGGAGVRIRVNPGFIGEPDLRASSFGALPEARVFDLKETVDRLRVLLIGAPQRSLRGEPQLLQEPADRCPAQHNPKLPAQDGAQDSACPQGERKLELPRITTGYRLVDPLNGPGVQFRPPAAPLARIQGFPSAATVQRQPSIYRRSTHTQHARYDFGRLAAMHGLHPTLANLRQFVVRQPASVAPHCGRDNTTSQSHCPDNCEKVSNRVLAGRRPGNGQQQRDVRGGIRRLDERACPSGAVRTRDRSAALAERAQLPAGDRRIELSREGEVRRHGAGRAECREEDLEVDLAGLIAREHGAAAVERDVLGGVQQVDRDASLRNGNLLAER